MKTPTKRSVEEINKMICSITDDEVRFGTDKFLPEFTPEFKMHDCIKIANGIFLGIVPKGKILFRPGIDIDGFSNRLVASHMAFSKTNVEHRIYGVAYLIWESSEYVNIF